MALNAATLATLIAAKVQAKIAPANLQADDLNEFAEAIAEAVVEHITANAAVVTVCPAGAGTGTVA